MKCFPSQSYFIEYGKKLKILRRVTNMKCYPSHEVFPFTKLLHRIWKQKVEDIASSHKHEVLPFT